MRFLPKTLCVLMTVVIMSSSPALAQTIWDSGGADDNWFTALNWDNDIVPNGFTEDVVVDAPSPTNANGNVNINSLAVGLDGILNINPSLNFDFGGTAAMSLMNAGTINIGNNSDFQLSNIASNSGAINSISTGNITDIEVVGAGATLEGGGAITLTGNNNARIVGVGGPLLTINDQTIQGRGQLGVNTLEIINNGNLIQADETGNLLTIDPSPIGMINSGTLRASGGGLLFLTGNGGGAFDNTNGTIEALAGSEVQFGTNASVTGGTFATTGDGLLRVNASQNVFFANLTHSGDMVSDNNSDTGFLGTINNTGSITLNSTGNTTDIEVQSGDATLIGGGTVTLTGSNNARIVGLADAVLTIDNQTIQGRGQLGVNTLEIINNGNLIQADETGNFLSIDPSAAGMTNTGTLRASGGGRLLLTGNGGGAFDNTNGTIEALAGSEVQFGTNASITGGTLATTGDGLLRVNASQNVFFANLTHSGDMVSDNNSDTGFLGTINNTGSITLNSTGNTTDIEVQSGDATLIGGGTITLSGTNNVRVIGLADTMLTIASQTIQGRGQLGVNSLEIVNNGNLINANVSEAGNFLTVDPSADGMINTGTLRASGGGRLFLTGNGGGAFNNTGGTIEALVGSEVQLSTNASITGGTLATTGDGLLRVNSSQDVFFADLTHSGDMISDNNSDTGFLGTINNTGSITINSTGNPTDIEVQTGDATLTGGGTITLTGSNAARVTGLAGTMLTIADQTIQGRGQLGVNTLEITNSGNLIHANETGNFLTIDPSPIGMINSGTLRASGGGLLFLTGNGGGAFDNTNGTIEALAGSEVQFSTNASITSGTLATTGDGLLRVNASQNVFFANLTHSGDMVSDNNSDTGLSGTIDNTGSITINSTGNTTDIEVQPGGAVLSGAGTVTLTTFNSRINGNGDLEMTEGTLAGNGQIDLDSLFHQGATIAPGNSVGTLTFNGNNTTQIVDGAAIEIELAATTGIQGVDWDFMDVTGTLDLADDALPSGVVIKLVTLNGSGDPGPLAGFDPAEDFSLVIATATTISNYSSSDFSFDLTGFSNAFTGEFSIAKGPLGSDDALYVKYGQFKLGDVNHDGVVNLLDVAPFVAALSAGQFISEADIDCNGTVNLLDVAPFVDLLAGG